MSTLLAATLSTLVFCAPGYPGGAGDAQPLVDQFASAAAAASGWPAGSLAAVYDPTEEGGLAKLGQRRCRARLRAVSVLCRARGATASDAARAGGRDGYRSAAAMDAGCKGGPRHRARIHGGIHDTQCCGLCPRFRAAQRARGLGAAAGRQDRVDGTDPERIEAGGRAANPSRSCSIRLRRRRFRACRSQRSSRP